MPTLYTALLARHRPQPEIPPAHIPGASPAARNTPLMATEQLSLVSSPMTARVRRKRPKKTIIVVGAGLAGLCAAYELRGLRYDVRVFEARDRVGGRVHSLTNLVSNKVVEGGGELIGANHPMWLAYQQHFRLKLTDVKDYGNSPIRFRRRTLTSLQSQALMDELDVQLKVLTDLARTIADPYEPWTNHNAKHLDSVSLGAWISGADCSVGCKHAIATMMATDNGVPASKQSLLGVLAMIKGGGLDRYWTDTELYRCDGGNQQLAECFRTRLNRQPKSVVTRAAVRRIEHKNGKACVTVRIGGHSHVETADEVIVAVPPSVWHTIRFPDPQLAGKLSRPPRMGANVKFLMTLRRRFWEDYASSPTLTEDGPVDLTWETTEADLTGDYLLVAFSGARDAHRCMRWRQRTRRARYVESLQTPYPKIGPAIRKTEFVNWPREKWTQASYYFPRVDDVMRWGPFWKTGYGGWLHFAGEHTCLAFVGYMEGALASGYRLARALAERDGLL